MKMVIFHRWSLEVDRGRTREAHSQLSCGGAEECDCTPCKNFVAVREQILVGEFRFLLDALGIDAFREVEVAHHCRVPSGLHSYGVWFHAVGRITAGADVSEFEVLSPHLSVGFKTGCDLVREPFRGLPLFQLEIQAEVPWVISAPEP
jgi:hypothetical protein